MKEPKKGVANVTRQTWDLEEYEKRAQLRASGQLETKEDVKKTIRSNKEEFIAAEEGAAGPAGSARSFLKARTQRVALENDVGTVKVMKADDLSKAGGYYCEVCECGLKDSIAYLDHINGKKHLRKLGYSMRVERSSVDDVKKRLQSAAKRKYDPVITKKLSAMEEYEKKLQVIEEEEQRAKRQKKEAKKLAKAGEFSKSTQSSPRSSTEAKEAAVVNTSDSNKEQQQEPDADAEMMAMMGFGGFGGSKKS